MNSIRNAIKDFYETNFGGDPIIAAVIIGTAALVVAGTVMLLQQWLYENSHTCVKSHIEMTYPTYVKSGNVMIPVGGGPDRVCDVWVKK